MNKFKFGDRVRIIVGQGKGMEGTIYHIITPNSKIGEKPHYAYLVKLKDDSLPWYAESELEEVKEKVIFT